MARDDVAGPERRARGRYIGDLPNAATAQAPAPRLSTATNQAPLAASPPVPTRQSAKVASVGGPIKHVR
jgi:hypothetical protein